MMQFPDVVTLGIGIYNCKYNAISYAVSSQTYV